MHRCNQNIPWRLKGKFYKTVVRKVLLYGSECWATKKQDEQKICGKTRNDKIRNEAICATLGVVPIDNKMRESRLSGLVMYGGDL